MSRLRETFAVMFLAAKFSFSFCWRNNKKETVGRLVISTATTLLLYLTVQSTGLIINATQSASVKLQGDNHTLIEIARSGLLGPLILMVGVLLFGVVLGRFNWFYRNKWNQTLRFSNQRELNNHRATLDVARFRSKEYDDLQKRIQELPMSWQTRIFFADEMFTLFTTILSFALFGASLVWYRPAYALVLIGVAIPMVVVEFKTVALWWSLFQDMVPKHKRRYMLERSYHSANPFVQALMFNQMPALGKEIDINVGEVLDSYDNVRKTSVRREMVTHLLAMSGLCGVIIHAVWTTVTLGGEMGTLTIIMAAARTFQGNLEQIVSLVADQWNSAKGVILIEKEFFGLKPLIQTKYPVIPRFDLTPAIRFDNVSFAYPDTERLVLRDVSFVIEPGTKVAVVGKSGAGKSTLLALLMRHHDPTEGAIYAGDINLRNIEPSVWSNVVSALTQEYTVLERRVGEEIASSRLDQPVDLQAVADAAKFADFEEVIASDPEGFGTQIGVEFGGREFSGGEKQRLALARVHYRGTPILVLDEPDAKLDPESAQRVIDQVFALKDVTVIMITHHVSRAERCDHILVMDKGQLAEQGSHDQLMVEGSLYRSMSEKDRERLGVQS